MSALPASLVFLVVVITVSQIFGRLRSHLVVPLLALASVLFYGIVDSRHLPLLLASITFNFWITGQIRNAGQHRKAFVTSGVIANLLPLLWCKYSPLYVQSGDVLGQLGGSGIPFGLSFFTFIQITALFDIQRSDAVRLDLFQHTLFSAFFAQMSAGPITPYRSLAPQIAKIGKPVALRGILLAISLVVLGLAKKMLLADPIGELVGSVHAAVHSGARPPFLEAWLTAWGFVLQLYFDFSGYSDIAIGLALACGLRLTPNFDSPLQSSSGKDFVDRWHMSLVAWIREYLFQPIFEALRRISLTNKQGRHKEHRLVISWAIATVISMVAIGAWHGSSLLLVLSGLLGGLLLVGTTLRKPVLLRFSRTNMPRPKPEVTRLLKQAGLLALLSVLDLLIRVENHHDLARFLRSMFQPLLLPRHVDYTRLPNLNGWVLPHAIGVFNGKLAFVLGTAIALLCPNTMQIFSLLEKRLRASGPTWRTRWRPSARWGAALGALTALLILMRSSVGGSFIYGRF